VAQIDANPRKLSAQNPYFNVFKSKSLNHIDKETMMSGTTAAATATSNNAPISSATVRSQSSSNLPSGAFSASLANSWSRQRSIGAETHEQIKAVVTQPTLARAHLDTVLKQCADPDFSPCEDMTHRETARLYQKNVLNRGFQSKENGPIVRCGTYKIANVNGVPRRVPK
jgi:hypothetical protein